MNVKSYFEFFQKWKGLRVLKTANEIEIENDYLADLKHGMFDVTGLKTGFLGCKMSDY